MKQPRLRELKPGQNLAGFYLVKSKRIKQTRDRKFFLDLDLSDASGEINAKLWDDFERSSQEFERGDVIKVEAAVDQYQDRLQLKIKRLRKSRPEDVVDLAELLPATKQDAGKMFEEVKAILAEVKNPHLQKLVELFFEDPELMDKFKLGPAARNIHHAYLGGLLEHVWRMLKSGRQLAKEVYPELDFDLVLVGTFVHDLGKIAELEFKTSPAYTKAGYLEGHVVLGLKLLDEKIAQAPGFPAELKLHLDHIVLSHHGYREWGAPVLPSTPEAMLIHHLDNLDAKLTMVEEAIAADLNEAEDFTGYHQILERHLYKRRPGPEGGAGT